MFEEYTMRNNLSKKNLLKCAVVGLCAVLTGCGTIGLAQEAVFESAYENKPEEETDIYLSECRGVLEDINTQDGTITLYRISEKDEMTVVYDNATVVQDKYGSSLTMNQLTPGEIVDLRYNSELNKAGSVSISSDTWCYDNVEKHEIDEGRGTLQVGSETYRISKETKVFSGGEQLSVDQILKQDILSLKGTGYYVSSIIVDKGHGYLKLQNEEALVGGFIEVGQAVIQQISENMLLTVPEGSYVVSLSAEGIKEIREITIVRNQEIVLDLGDIEVPSPVNGRVVFSVYPEQASVSVDGVGINAAYPILMSFGLHQVTASADGYDTVSEYINVEGETTNVRLVLDESKADTVSGNKLEEDSSHTITIQAPVDVEVYQDNLYMGIAPVTYKKTEGSQTITLRKTGYVTKSYQIEVEDDDRDLVYSFPELTTETESADGRDTVSGNTVSGNRSEKSDSSSSNKGTVSGNQSDVSGNDL